MLKRIFILTAAVFTAASIYVSAETYPVAELVKNPDFAEITVPRAADYISAEEHTPILFLSAENPSASDIEQAELSGNVEGGTISDDGKYITYENGKTASVYTLTINSGDYTIDGFCLSCKYDNESILKDFYMPTVTGGNIEVNIVVNRPEAKISLATLKSGGKDAFNGGGAPYSFEIVEGNPEDWRVSEDGHTIEEYIGETVDELVIPNMLDGKMIFSVQNESLIDEGRIGTLFGEYNSQTGLDVPANTVEISDGIQVIGTFLFYQCSDLEGEIDIPVTVRAIGPYAFAGCSGLSGNLDLSGCAALYSYSFAGCSGLKGELILPEVETIPRGIFLDCPLSGEVVIPEGVEIIGDYAFAMNFSSANGISAIDLPSTLKRIGAVAFQHRSSVKNEIELPDGLTHIGDFAFNHCTGFTNTSVRIPSTVKSIGGDLNIAQGNSDVNTGYGGHVFYDAFYKSTEFIMDSEDGFCVYDGVLMSSDGARIVAYPMAKTDESFVIPEGVTQIDEMAFGRTKVKSVTLPDSFVFSTDIPDNIINKTGNNFAVAMYVYNNCSEVLVKDTNPNYKSVDGIIYSKDGTELWYVPDMHGEVVIEDGCEVVRDGAFYCSGSPVYTKWGEVYIPASVKEIESNSLTFLNSSGATLTVASENAVYTVSNNKIVKK